MNTQSDTAAVGVKDAMREFADEDSDREYNIGLSSKLTALRYIPIAIIATIVVAPVAIATGHDCPGLFDE